MWLVSGPRDPLRFVDFTLLTNSVFVPVQVTVGDVCCHIINPDFCQQCLISASKKANSQPITDPENYATHTLCC